jgi:hypothetical protein
MRLGSVMRVMNIMTRVRDNDVRECNESNEYFQQFMTRVRDNRVRKG